MGIQFFDEPVSTSSDIPFAREFLDSNPQLNGSEHLVNEIVLVRSNKGYLCKTDKFVCWIWKRESTATLLVQALAVYVRDMYGYSIIAVLDRTKSNGFKLGVNPDLPCMWYGSEKKYTTAEDIPSFNPMQENPFLISHAPLTPTTGVVTPTGMNGASHKRHGKNS